MDFDKDTITEGKKTLSLMFAALLLGASLTSVSANAACLQFMDNGRNAWWQNNCSFPVSVKWTSDSPCEDWSCQDTVPGNGRQSINQGQDNVNWLECRGISCNPRCGDARRC